MDSGTMCTCEEDATAKEEYHTAFSDVETYVNLQIIYRAKASSLRPILATKARG